MKVKYLVGAIPMLLMCSCDNELNNIVGGNTSEKAIITTSPYEFEEGTRTVLTNTGSAISFAWDDNEAIGIFPIAPTTNSQAKQVITKKEGSTTTAVFDGAGWELKKGNTYAAYYPYKDLMSSATYDAVPVDYTGQVQDGNGSLAHIGANYDYMYAVSGEPTNGIVNFDLKHIGSVVMLELTMPDAGEWKNLTLTAGSEVFVTKGTMNVSNGTVSATTKAKSISLELKNVKTTAANQTITLYLSVLPAITGEVKATVANGAGKEYTATLASKAIKAGKAYKWSVQYKKKPEAPAGVEAVDLGLSVKWANMNIGATTVTGYGKYYAWGEVEPQSNNRYYWDSYKLCEGSNDKLTKYCLSSSFGIVDNNSKLLAEDDAATANWGENWRIPSKSEWEELINKCHWVWTSSYNGSGIKGYIIYVKKSGYSWQNDYTLSDKHIFLPAGGGYWSSYPSSIGSLGHYWGGTMEPNVDSGAFYVYFGSGAVNSYYEDRCYGKTVRAVCK